MTTGQAWLKSWWQAHELEFVADGVVLGLILVFVFFVGVAQFFAWRRRRKEWERRVDEQLRSKR